jgi:hypothetical protein
MRAREFITETQLPGIHHEQAKALPATYVIPALQNQDPYLQYRFGVAIAKAKGQIHDTDPVPKYAHESAWGENQIVVSFDPGVEKYIDLALKEIGLSPGDKKLISSPKSEESNTVNIISPVAKIKKNKYGV